MISFSSDSKFFKKKRICTVCTQKQFKHRPLCMSGRRAFSLSSSAILRMRARRSAADDESCGRSWAKCSSREGSSKLLKSSGYSDNHVLNTVDTALKKVGIEIIYVHPSRSVIENNWTGPQIWGRPERLWNRHDCFQSWLQTEHSREKCPGKINPKGHSSKILHLVGRRFQEEYHYSGSGGIEAEGVFFNSLDWLGLRVRMNQSIPAPECSEPQTWKHLVIIDVIFFFTHLLNDFLSGLPFSPGGLSSLFTQRKVSGKIQEKLRNYGYWSLLCAQMLWNNVHLLESNSTSLTRRKLDGEDT